MTAVDGPIHLDAPKVRRTGKMPPFGKEVQAAIVSRKPLNVYVYAGRGAWDRAKARRAAHGPASAMLLPDDSTPEALCWPAVPGGVLAVCDGLEYRARLALGSVLVASGCRLAVVCDVGGAESLTCKAS